MNKNEKNTQNNQNKKKRQFYKVAHKLYQNGIDYIIKHLIMGYG